VIARAVADAETATGLVFRVHVGALDAGRASAQALLAGTTDAPRTVLVAVDPARRALEIVTGSLAARQVDDRTCGLACLAMTSSFAAGDLVGGLRDGLRLIGDHARVSMRSRH